MRYISINYHGRQMVNTQTLCDVRNILIMFLSAWQKVGGS